VSGLAGVAVSERAMSRTFNPAERPAVSQSVTNQCGAAPVRLRRGSKLVERHVCGPQWAPFRVDLDTGVLGAAFSPGGKVLVVALGDSIEFWDAAKGTLRGRLMTPEELHVLVYPEGPVAPVLALDSTGQTIYVLSVSGLSMLKLPAPLDQIPVVQRPLLAHSSSTQVEFRRPITSRMAATRGHARK
jgi:WD40 repeat protein